MFTTAACLLNYGTSLRVASGLVVPCLPPASLPGSALHPSLSRPVTQRLTLSALPGALSSGFCWARPTDSCEVEQHSSNLNVRSGDLVKVQMLFLQAGDGSQDSEFIGHLGTTLRVASSSQHVASQASVFPEKLLNAHLTNPPQTSGPDLLGKPQRWRT